MFQFRPVHSRRYVHVFRVYSYGLISAIVIIIIIYTPRVKKAGHSGVVTGVRGCGPHRAALARAAKGRKTPKIKKKFR